MGIHLPFVGYFRARGNGSAVSHRYSGRNALNEGKLIEFFRVMRDRDLEDLARYTPIWGDIDDRDRNFGRIFFENDTFNRPKLADFISADPPKALVITSWSDLYESFDQNAVVNRFFEQSMTMKFPVLCLDQKDFQLTPNFLRAMNDENLAHHIWNNQQKMVETIQAHQSQPRAA